MTQKCIAVLGYGEGCSELNLERAFQAGHKIALHGYAVCAGNLAGTFHHAFNGAKSIAGTTIAILEKSNTANDVSLCDAVLYADDTDQKHRMIARTASAAIVIGGGPGTNKLINRLLEEKKPVIAIHDSGGAADSQPDRGVKIVADIEKAIDYILDKAKHDI